MEGLTDEMVEKARQAIEDAAIERRDSMIFVMCGNGITVRNRDGSDSAIHRMRSGEAFRIGLQAIEPQLVALITAQALREAADAWFEATCIDGGWVAEQFLRDRADAIEARS